jgi:hypothetical protein
MAFFLLLVLVPPIFVGVPLLARDIVFGLLFGLTITLVTVLKLRQSPWRFRLIVAVVLVGLCCAVRQEGGVLGAPLFFWIFLEIVQGSTVSRGKKSFLLFVVPIVLSVSITVGVSGAFSFLTGNQSCPESESYMINLMHLSAETGRELYPVTRKEARAERFKCSEAVTLENFRRIRERMRIFNLAVSQCGVNFPARCEESKKRFFRAVFKHPVALMKVFAWKFYVLLRSYHDEAWISGVQSFERFYKLQIRIHKRRERTLIREYCKDENCRKLPPPAEIFQIPRFVNTGVVSGAMLRESSLRFLMYPAIGIHLLGLSLFLFWGGAMRKSLQEMGVLFSTTGIMHLLLFSVMGNGHLARTMFWFTLSAVLSGITLVGACTSRRS